MNTACLVDESCIQPKKSGLIDYALLCKCIAYLPKGHPGTNFEIGTGAINIDRRLQESVQLHNQDERSYTNGGDQSQNDFRDEAHPPSIWQGFEISRMPGKPGWRWCRQNRRNWISQSGPKLHVQCWERSPDRSCVRILQIYRRRQDTVADGENRENSFNSASGTQQVAGARLGRTHGKCCAESPKARLIAAVSPLSPTGVEVPCAFR